MHPSRVQSRSLLEDRTKKVAVLIDEVASDPNSELFVRLLKDAYPHLVTIGSAVPRFITTGVTGMFKTKVRMQDLVLKEEDENFQELCGTENHHNRPNSDHLQVSAEAMRRAHFSHTGFHRVLL